MLELMEKVMVIMAFSYKQHFFTKNFQVKATKDVQLVLVPFCRATVEAS